jgi:hypothetical protein
MKVHRFGIRRNVLVFAEVISTADDSDCREGAVELYHASPQFRRFLSAAHNSTNSSEEPRTKILVGSRRSLDGSVVPKGEDRHSRLRAAFGSDAIIDDLADEQSTREDIAAYVRCRLRGSEKHHNDNPETIEAAAERVPQTFFCSISAVYVGCAINRACGFMAKQHWYSGECPIQNRINLLHQLHNVKLSRIPFGIIGLHHSESLLIRFIANQLCHMPRHLRINPTRHPFG